MAASHCLCTQCQAAVRASSDRNGGWVEAFSEYAPAVRRMESETCGPSAPPSWGRLLPAEPNSLFRIIPVAMTDTDADRFPQESRGMQPAGREVGQPARKGALAATCRRLDQARRECRGKTIQILAALKPLGEAARGHGIFGTIFGGALGGRAVGTLVDDSCGTRAPVPRH